ncbi:hypothetical protein I553_1049 [Mycobacterium xenopi 4042]|uniref:Uncharacterized protein n=1 Tax=Mycobacterium xenopi 4042 TaxID=1299334 RepID=X7Z9L8_MYCXE|nr:hypothetical protein I553_1049 [Mycobacterium xenopi 4042]
MRLLQVGNIAASWDEHSHRAWITGSRCAARWNAEVTN